MPMLPAIVERQSRHGDPGLAELSTLTGSAFLGAASAWLQQSLGCFAVSIGDKAGALGDQINVRAFHSRDPDLSPERYDLFGSPCQDVLGGDQPVAVASGALARHPEDAMFRDLGIDSYVGVPLHNPAGRAIGLVCAFDTCPLNVEETMAALNWLAPRIGQELFQLRHHDYTLSTVRWIGQSGADEVFGNLTQSLASIMQISTCIVTEWPEDDPDHYRIVSCYHAGAQSETLTGSLWNFDDSPCAELRDGQDALMVTDGLAQRWPRSPLVTICGTDSCYAVTLRGRSGETLGHLMLSHIGQMPARAAVEPAMALMRARAAAEMQRIQLDRERKQIADSLMSKQKLESLGLMAGGIAHDFNNLLVGIIGNVNLAMAHTSRDGEGYLSRVETAALRAGDILRQLLEYAGKGFGAPEALSLTDAVKAASELLTLSTGRNARIRYDLEDGLPPTQADPAQLQQVIMNLVLNASDALEGQPGNITVCTRLAELERHDIRALSFGRDLAEGTYLELEVTDTGSGMDAATMKRIFDPFFTSKPTGRGLGLSALQGFARNHHAGIGVSSTPGAGTRMCLYLQPRQDAQRESPPLVQVPRGRLEVDRPILIVDDDDGVRSVTAELLGSLDYQVQSCENGESAVASCLAGGSYAAAFIDISMPGLDGWTTLAGLREIDPELPVVMMSGLTNQTSASELARERRAQFLKKPFCREDLNRALHQAVGQD